MTMQRNYFSILFFIRRTRLLKNGESPIGLRITVNGQFSIKKGYFVALNPNNLFTFADDKLTTFEAERSK